jgi:hypothetical protein
VKALLLPLLLLGADEPVYPLGPRPARSLVEPGRPFVLSDLQYRYRQEGDADQAFSARVRVASWGFLGAFADGQRRGASLQTQRLQLGYFEDPSFKNLQAGWRGSRVLLDVAAEQRPPQDGGGWQIEGELGLRVTPDLEAFVTVSADTDRDRPSPSRQLDEQRLGFLWQRGTRLDLAAAIAHSERRTEAGFDLETTRVSASGAGLAWSSEISAEAGYQKTTGALPHDELFADAGLQSVLARRLIASAVSRNRWEPGATWFEHELGFGLKWHARRVRLARAGDAAARTLELARRACALGYNERRVYDDDGRRALRERLALSPRRAELETELLALHQAQIDERNVELLSASVAEQSESVTGVRRRSFELGLGVPWRARWPWQGDEAATPFLNARYTQVRARYANGFTSTTHQAALQAELTREMALVLRWRRPGLTPLDVSFVSGRHSSWEVEYAYALGR